MDDDATALLLGDLAESTKLPRELLARFDEMWRARQQPGVGGVVPFHSSVSAP